MKSNKSQWMFVVSLFAACTLACLPAVGQKQGPGPGPSQVLVVNGTGSPVPVAAQGTTNVAGTVNVGNTPNVNVANMPNVNIANTPSVSITGTPTVTLAPGGSTNVTNPLDGQGNPTPLATLEAIQPYSDFCLVSFAGGEAGSCAFSSLPSTKFLVIQEFDSYSTLETGLKPITVSLEGGLGNIPHYFPAAFMGSYNGFDYYSGHQETRLYIPEGPVCFIELSGFSNEAYECQLSGFLLDVPIEGSGVVLPAQRQHPTLPFGRNLGARQPNNTQR